METGTRAKDVPNGPRGRARRATVAASHSELAEQLHSRFPPFLIGTRPIRNRANSLTTNEKTFSNRYYLSHSYFRAAFHNHDSRTPSHDSQSPSHSWRTHTLSGFGGCSNVCITTQYCSVFSRKPLICSGVACGATISK